MNHHYFYITSDRSFSKCCLQRMNRTDKGMPNNQQKQETRIVVYVSHSVRLLLF